MVFINSSGHNLFPNNIYYVSGDNCLMSIKSSAQ